MYHPLHQSTCLLNSYILNSMINSYNFAIIRQKNDLSYIHYKKYLKHLGTRIKPRLDTIRTCTYIHTLHHMKYIIYHRSPALPTADSLSTGTIVQPLQKARCTSQRNIIRVAWESFLSFASFSHFISH